MTTPLKSFDDTGAQFAWDATSLSNYAKCPRYYQFVNLEGWQPSEKSVHLVFGGHYAKAVEDYHKLLHSGMSHDDAQLFVVRQAMLDTWLDREVDPETGETLPGTGHEWIVLEGAKTRETLIRSIIWYLEEYRDDPLGPSIIDGKPAVELSFALPFGDDYLYCGHMDRLTEKGGDHYVMDQKTTGGAIGGYFYDQFSVDFQMSGYTWAGKQMFNLAVRGVIIDAAQILVGGTKFGRQPVLKSAAQLEEWEWVANSLITRARRDTQEDTFVPNYASCGNYGGCPFRKVCARGQEFHARALKADFYRAPRWDPLERR